MKRQRQPKQTQEQYRAMLARMQAAGVVVASNVLREYLRGQVNKERKDATCIQSN